MTKKLVLQKIVIFYTFFFCILRIFMNSVQLYIQSNMYYIILIVFVVVINRDTCYGYDELNTSNIKQSRPSQQSPPCTRRRFTCYSGSPKCISFSRLCDGVTDCEDGSDETYQECHNNECPEYTFRCSYGACIDGNLKCNGEIDCSDNSDESNCGPVEDPDICRSSQFTCDSGECISKFSLCDGVPECSDQSDETSKHCSSNQCNEYSFQCRYGACIDGESVCNGIVDCIDGSDEIEQYCKWKQQKEEDELITDGCELPLRPRNGGYRTKARVGEGQLVPFGTYITFYCNPGYVIRPARATIVQCLKTRNWTNPSPQCLVECPRLSSISQDITYSVPDDQPLVSGTIATIKCKSAYKTPVNDPMYRHITCLDTGHWNQPIFNCTSKCGIETLNVRPLIVNGMNTTAPEFPWNVGIYRSNEKYNEDHQHICGGTIISERLILSAAHCFYDTSIKGLNPKSEYFIGAGKTHRDWFADQTIDPYQQLRKVHKVIIHNEYKGLFSSHINDIAFLIIKTKEHLNFNDVVRPACIDWDNEYKDIAFRKGSVGTVVGWGLTEVSGNRSEILKRVNLPFIPKYPDCFDSLPENVRQYLLHDKICAGTTNGTGVCQGDSGSGLMFKNPGNSLWYLRALVSFDPAFGDSCDPYSYTAFTDLSFHKDWMVKYTTYIL